MKGTVLGDKEQGIRDKGKGIKGKTEVEFDTEDQVLFSLVLPKRFLDELTLLEIGGMYSSVTLMLAG